MKTLSLLFILSSAPFFSAVAHADDLPPQFQGKWVSGCVEYDDEYSVTTYEIGHGPISSTSQVYTDESCRTLKRVEKGYIAYQIDELGKLQATVTTHFRGPKKGHDDVEIKSEDQLDLNRDGTLTITVLSLKVWLNGFRVPFGVDIPDPLVMRKN